MAASHEFAVHEWVALEWALRLWDLSDRRLAEAGATSDGRQSARLEKQGLDAATAALRHWRLLKFSDGEPARRPGRPSDRGWSAIRSGRVPLRPGA